MIVECKNCTTRFALDDSRIPLAGIRVRCSKCKEAFFLEHPAATQEQAVDSIAFDAAGGEPAQQPDVTQDLVTPSPSSSATGAGLEDEEEWEFNHDVPDEPAASSTSSELATGGGASGIELAAAPGAEDTAVPSGPEAAADSATSPAAAEAAVEDYSPNDEVSFDDSEVDISGIDVAGIDESEVGVAGTNEDDSDFDHGAIDDLAGAVHPDGSSHPGGPADPYAASTASEAGSAAPDVDSRARGEAPAASSGSKQGTTADLGEPEDWDLLGEDSPSPAPEVSQQASLAFEAATATQATTHMSSPHAAAAGVSMPSSLPASIPAMRLQSALRNVSSAVGWVVTLALLGAVLGQAVMRSLATNPAGAATQFEVGPLVARSIETSWVATRDGKTLLAVRGELHNPTNSAVRPGLDVTVSLLDSSGVPLDLPGLVAGRTIDSDSLRELPGLQREQLGIEATSVLSSGPVPAGRSVAFGAYFSDVPVEARRVSVSGVQPPAAYDASKNSPWGGAAPEEADAESNSAPGAEVGQPADGTGVATEAA